MRFINASGWRQVSKTCFSVKPAPPLTPETCREHYHAFAWLSITDSNNALAGRDHFGLEPFYYYVDSQQFIFGSNIPDILKKLNHIPALNQQRCILECFSRATYTYTPYDTATFHTGIHRLTPGHLLHIKHGQVMEQSFWQLDRNVPTLHYHDERDYLAHFSHLLTESVRFQCKGETNIAAEFSGGLDSSALLVAYQKNALQPCYFTHEHPKDSEEHQHSLALINHFQLTDAHQIIDAEHFDPLKTFDWCVGQFAGAPPYLFFMLAHNLHQAVAANGAKILLSGFGGDECVSGYAPPRAYLPQALREISFKHAWQTLRDHQTISQGAPNSKLRRLHEFLRYSHPTLYRGLTLKSPKVPLPYCPTLHAYEYALLQGKHSHNLRMRIEYSAIVAKALGFEYRYPLLYPPLVEFCFSLPLEQKRRLGMGRYLIRQYLQQHTPLPISAKLKMTGSICDATLQKCLHYLESGYFSKAFTDLPFQTHWQINASQHEQLLERVFAYMFKAYLP